MIPPKRLSSEKTASGKSGLGQPAVRVLSAVERKRYLVVMKLEGVRHRRTLAALAK